MFSHAWVQVMAIVLGGLFIFCLIVIPAELIKNLVKRSEERQKGQEQAKYNFRSEYY